MASETDVLSAPAQNGHLNGRSATESTPLLAQGGSGDLEIFKSEDVSTTTMFWQEMGTIPKYALPVFGSQILEFSMVYVSVISIGHLSTITLAAVSLGSMTANVTGLSILQGLASALDTLLPSAYTSPQPQLVGLWAQRMGVVMMFALAPILLIWFYAEPILLSLKQDREVAHLAAIYLQWLSFGLPAFAFNVIMRRYFQSQGLFYVQTRIISIVAPINVFLNWLLVWGPEPFRLGFIGAPISSAMSLWLVSFTTIFHLVFLVPRTTFHPPSMMMFTNLGLLVRLGLSGIAGVASEWWAWEFVALAASLLGPVALASQSILITTGAMFFQLSFAVASATAIRIGNLLGEKNATRAKVAANTSLVVALLASLINSTILLVSRKSWAKLFNNDPEVVNLVAAVIPIIILFQILDANSAVTSGILRARGKQFVSALLNMTGYYIIGLPLGALFAFQWHLDLQGLWLGVTVSLLWCATIGTVLCVKTDWNQEVLKVMARLAEEERLRKAADEERRLP
ncbi:putative multidrug oligosaccharidyl-lipid polysaccharide flippase [Lyophyllum shimeji]|uniref:Multidrug oligosaccharidyl-lipid polysaccharide flippase n=1 Tax=Lyophyllum shimeji TaxID=47721 RepID=A0A9P3PY47_LYOSH|nr:putative multidrug oligosaccharidyl-lipid polysaccharide flippase [Lyophyllum shimeji]